MIFESLPTWTSVYLNTTAVGKFTSAVAAYLFIRHQAVHFARNGEGAFVRDTIERICALVAQLGYKLRLGKAATPVYMNEEGKVAISLAASCKSKLVQTKQNVREVKEGKVGVTARIVCKL